MRMEAALNKGIVKIATDLQEGDMSATQVVAILTQAIRGGGNNVNEKDVGKAVWEAGLAEGMRCAAEVIAVCLTAGGNAEGNVEAAAV